MKSCLVVDDSSVVRKVARRILEDMDFVVDEAEDGQEAFEKCSAEMPDSILLDWNMPVMSGLDFLKKLRAYDGGDKPRVVPLSQRALAWIERYLDEARPRLLRDPKEEAIFVGSRGKPLEPGHLTKIVGDYVRASDLGKKGSCHAFRHTMATLMLENGADLRHVQEILGHANVQTTQIYTQVTLRKLREVYKRTHPSLLPIRPDEDTEEPPDRKTREAYLRTLLKEDHETEDKAAEEEPE